jgi:hypothetical protein
MHNNTISQQCIDPPCLVKCSGQGGGFVSCSPKYIKKKKITVRHFLEAYQLEPFLTPIVFIEILLLMGQLKKQVIAGEHYIFICCIVLPTSTAVLSLITINRSLNPSLADQYDGIRMFSFAELAFRL